MVFTVTITNAGPDFATSVQVTDLLASGYLRTRPTIVPAPMTRSPACGMSARWPRRHATLNITATVNATGSYANTAQVTASQDFDPDSTPNNNAGRGRSGLDHPHARRHGPAPVAVNDSSLHNPPGPVTLNVTNNDTDPNLDLVVSTVD